MSWERAQVLWGATEETEIVKPREKEAEEAPYCALQQPERSFSQGEKVDIFSHIIW